MLEYDGLLLPTPEFHGHAPRADIHTRSKPAGDPDNQYKMARGRGGWVVGGTMIPSPSTDRHYRDFNHIFQYIAGTYVTGTRYLTGRY